LSTEPAGLHCAFVSTPSLFFALDPAERSRCRVLDFDKSLGDGCAEFVEYDFRQPVSLPAHLQGAFKSVVIDPPYVTEEVWRSYATTAKWLLPEDGSGLILGTTIIENAPLLEELLGVRPNVFLPSIPNLPYQYATYSNFSAAALKWRNEEVPHDPESFLSQAQDGAEANRRPADELPIVGGSGQGAYDFEAMIEAELKRAQQQQS